MDWPDRRARRGSIAAELAAGKNQQMLIARNKKSPARGALRGFARSDYACGALFKNRRAAARPRTPAANKPRLLGSGTRVLPPNSLT